MTTETFNWGWNAIRLLSWFVCVLYVLPVRFR